MEVKKWYIKKYPNDDLGRKINEKITFKGLLEDIKKGLDVYMSIGVFDSVIRERVFEGLSESMGIDYDTIYDLWIYTPRCVC